MAAPFEKAIDEHHRLAEAQKGFSSETAPSGEGTEVMVIRYREEEAMYIQASHDRVTVIFSTVFREETDRIFGKVFLSVCSDGREEVDNRLMLPSHNRNLSTRDDARSRTPHRFSSATTPHLKSAMLLG